jgi:hypothetical protein
MLAFNVPVRLPVEVFFGNALANTESTRWKRMRSGDRPGLQNRRAAGNPVAGGFDPHSLPPFFNELRRVAIRSQSVECQSATLEAHEERTRSSSNAC